MLSALALIAESQSLLSALHNQAFPLNELSRSSAAVLQLVAQAGPQTVPQLARSRVTSRQNIRIIVNRLVKAGHLELLPNANHKRSDLLRLTDSGRTLQARISEHENSRLKALAGMISESELDSARTVLVRLRQLLSGT